MYPSWAVPTTWNVAFMWLVLSPFVFLYPDGVVSCLTCYRLGSFPCTVSVRQHNGITCGEKRNSFIRQLICLGNNKKHQHISFPYVKNISWASVLFSTALLEIDTMFSTPDQYIVITALVLFLLKRHCNETRHRHMSLRQSVWYCLNC